MKCSIEGCPGEDEERLIVHTVRYQGEVVIIEQVPAEMSCWPQRRYAGWKSFCREQSSRFVPLPLYLYT